MVDNPDWWKKKYIEPGETFLAIDFELKMGEDGTMKSLTGVGAGQIIHIADRHFKDGVMVGKKIEKRESSMGDIHSPLYLERSTGKLYHIVYVGPKRRSGEQ